jgi:proteasome lid subunit RPN8/RPN11
VNMPQVEESSTDDTTADAAGADADAQQSDTSESATPESGTTEAGASALGAPAEPQVDVESSAEGDDGQSEPPPDAGSLVADDWPFRELAVVKSDRTGYQAVVRQSALNQIHRHGAETDVEVCGVLVGNVYRDETGPYLYISDIIRGDQATGRSTQVTFTADTWTHIQTTMDQKFAEQRIVGWYHTHPSFGIFLSGMDLFIQENFFNLPWQVALVYDPVGKDEGIFYWRQGRTDREPFLIDNDEPAAPTESPRPHEAELEAEQSAGPASSRETRHAPLWLVALTGFLTSFSVTYFLLMYFSPALVPPPAKISPQAASMPIVSAKPLPTILPTPTPPSSSAVVAPPKPSAPAAPTPPPIGPGGKRVH